MAHSFRHTPIFGNCLYKPREMRWWKKYSNRAMRRKVHQRLQSGGWEELPHKVGEVVDEWKLPADGKRYMPDLMHTKHMRK